MLSPSNAGENLRVVTPAIARLPAFRPQVCSSYGKHFRPVLVSVQLRPSQHWAPPKNPLPHFSPCCRQDGSFSPHPLRPTGAPPVTNRATTTRARLGTRMGTSRGKCQTQIVAADAEAAHTACLEMSSVGDLPYDAVHGPSMQHHPSK